MSAQAGIQVVDVGWKQMLGPGLRRDD